jgi:hypothetical protein
MYTWPLSLSTFNRGVVVDPSVTVVWANAAHGKIDAANIANTFMVFSDQTET